MYSSHKKGYMALASSVIISLALLAAVLRLNESHFYFDQLLLNKEFKMQSRVGAYSCINRVLLILAQDPYYVPGAEGDSKYMLGGECVITSILGTNVKEVNLQFYFKTVRTGTSAKVDMDKEPLQVYEVVEYP